MGIDIDSYVEIKIHGIWKTSMPPINPIHNVWWGPGFFTKKCDDHRSGDCPTCGGSGFHLEWYRERCNFVRSILCQHDDVKTDIPHHRGIPKDSSKFISHIFDGHFNINYLTLFELKGLASQIIRIGKTDPDYTTKRVMNFVELIREFLSPLGADDEVRFIYGFS